MDNISYHGTNDSNAKVIIGPPPGLNISIGKGELGKGFYTGSSIALAAIWAQNRYSKNGVVIKFDIPEERFVKLKGCVVRTQLAVIDNWQTLKDEGRTTSHEYGYDYIIAPFALIQHTGNQYKFESKQSEIELNAATKNVFKCDF